MQENALSCCLELFFQTISAKSRSLNVSLILVQCSPCGKTHQGTQYRKEGSQMVTSLKKTVCKFTRIKPVSSYRELKHFSDLWVFLHLQRPLSDEVRTAASTSHPHRPSNSSHDCESIISLSFVINSDTQQLCM